MTLNEKIAVAILEKFSKPGHEVVAILAARRIADVCVDVVRAELAGSFMSPMSNVPDGYQEGWNDGLEDVLSQLEVA